MGLLEVKIAGRSNEYSPASGNEVGAVAVSQHSLPVDFNVLVDPTIGGVVTPEILIDGESAAGTDYVPHLLRVTMGVSGYMDDVTAANRLKAGAPEVFWALHGETLELNAAGPVTSVYIIGVTYAEAAIDVDTFTDYKYLIGAGDTDLSDWLAQMARFDFAANDNVRKILVTLTQPIGTNTKLAKVQGVSYA
jgi:hypothetical protein